MIQAVGEFIAHLIFIRDLPRSEMIVVSIPSLLHVAHACLNLAIRKHFRLMLPSAAMLRLVILLGLWMKAF